MPNIEMLISPIPSMLAVMFRVTPQWMLCARPYRAVMSAYFTVLRRVLPDLGVVLAIDPQSDVIARIA